MEPDTAQRDGLLAADVAGFGQRFLARVVDALVLLVPNLLLITIFDGYAEVAAVGILDLAYEIPQLALTGRTLGKRALGIRVVTVDGGANPTAGQAFVRVVLPQVLFFSPSATLADLAPLWSFAVYGPLFLDPQRRGLHDKAAGTRVVRDA